MADKSAPTPVRATQLSPTQRPARSNAPKFCQNCKKPGHLARECRTPYKCWNCGKPGHLQKYCRQPRATEPPPPSRYAGTLAQIAAAAQAPPPPPPLPPSIPVATDLSCLLVRCDTCGARSHNTERCPITLFGFSDANERAIDELPSIPVRIKPIKTAAALETERKYKEKLAAREAGDDKAEDEKSGDKAVSSKVNEPGDLIEFD